MINFDLDNKQDRILTAALICFKQYGFKRTSMLDIAKETNISRPALYLLFKNKTDIFRSLTERFHHETLSNAKKALAVNHDISARITAGIIARKAPLFALARGSLHGPELFDVTMSAASDINQKANEQFFKLLKKTISNAAQEGQLILPNAISTQDLTTLIHAGAYGLKDAAKDVKHYKSLLTKMVHTMLASLLPEEHTKIH